MSGLTSSLRVGTQGEFHGVSVEIIAILGPDSIQILDRQSMNAQVISVEHFRLAHDPEAPIAPIHDDSREWASAEKRYEIIAPLIAVVQDHARLTLADVKARAALAGVHYTTVYKWLRQYEDAGGVPSGLKPRLKARGNREVKLDNVVDAILRSTIKEVYLNKQRPSIKGTYRELVTRCRAAGLTTPHYNTLRRRIAQLPERQKLFSRNNKKLASERYDLRPGSLTVDRPWQLIQIDGTPADVLLVDEKHRKPIGKAHMTIAIDVYSRMIVGFYVSLEAESATTAGLCLANAMLPKAPWLASRGIEDPWPCHGRPVAVHADNGMAFRSKMLQRVCKEYQITLEFRPLKRPEFGGHIEALNKTIARKIHEAPGTTFFDVADRAEYPSERLAGLTLEEFERWLCEAVLEYHEEFHSMISGSPRARYTEAYLIKDGRFRSPHPKSSKTSNVCELISCRLKTGALEPRASDFGILSTHTRS